VKQELAANHMTVITPAMLQAHFSFTFKARLKAFSRAGFKF
jgi:hypothetical protein